MKKTGGEILSDVYDLVAASGLPGFVNGGLYRNQRPTGSGSEDIVVSFTEGTDGQFQEGVVAVDIYVPDTDDGTGSGELVQDTARTDAVEKKVKESVPAFTSAEYLFTLDRMIHTYKYEDAPFHCVGAALRFRKSTAL